LSTVWRQPIAAPILPRSGEFHEFIEQLWQFAKFHASPVTNFHNPGLPCHSKQLKLPASYPTGKFRITILALVVWPWAVKYAANKIIRGKNDHEPE